MQPKCFKITHRKTESEGTSLTVNTLTWLFLSIPHTMSYFHSNCHNRQITGQTYVHADICCIYIYIYIYVRHIVWHSSRLRWQTWYFHENPVAMTLLSEGSNLIDEGDLELAKQCSWAQWMQPLWWVQHTLGEAGGIRSEKIGCGRGKCEFLHWVHPLMRLHGIEYYQMHIWFSLALAPSKDACSLLQCRLFGVFLAFKIFIQRYLRRKTEMLTSTCGIFGFDHLGGLPWTKGEGPGPLPQWNISSPWKKKSILLHRQRHQFHPERQLFVPSRIRSYIQYGQCGYPTQRSTRGFQL